MYSSASLRCLCPLGVPHLSHQDGKCAAATVHVQQQVAPYEEAMTRAMAALTTPITAGHVMTGVADTATYMFCILVRLFIPPAPLHPSFVTPEWQERYHYSACATAGRAL